MRLSLANLLKVCFVKNWQMRYLIYLTLSKTKCLVKKIYFTHKVIFYWLSITSPNQVYLTFLENEASCERKIECYFSHFRFTFAILLHIFDLPPPGHVIKTGTPCTENQIRYIIRPLHFYSSGTVPTSRKNARENSARKYLSFVHYVLLLQHEKVKQFYENFQANNSICFFRSLRFLIPRWANIAIHN